MVMVLVAVTNNLQSSLGEGGEEALRSVYLMGLVVIGICSIALGMVVFFQINAIASRLKELCYTVAKLGRGNEVRVRYSGNDEVAELGQSLQTLSIDLSALLGGDDSGESGGGLAMAFDPQLRELRDKTLPQGMTAASGFELDGALSPGSRGGLDYFDAVTTDGNSRLFMVSAEGNSVLSIVALRMARDECLRALKTGASARKSLSHTNRIMHRNLPGGVCAKCCILEVTGDKAKVYHAGYRVPLLLCARGELEEVSGEGLALGLDAGPVFEKGLRSISLDLSPGMRLVQLNEAGWRQEGLQDLVQEHSPKHTAAFMNMVLGAVETEAGEEGLREDLVLLTAKRS